MSYLRPHPGQSRISNIQFVRSTIRCSHNLILRHPNCHYLINVVNQYKMKREYLSNPSLERKKKTEKYYSIYQYQSPHTYLRHINPVCQLGSSCPAQISYFIIPPAIKPYCNYKILQIRQRKLQNHPPQGTKKTQK